MASQRESTQSGLGSSTWLARMIGEFALGRFYVCGGTGCWSVRWTGWTGVEGAREWSFLLWLEGVG
jgi:hypothetical protein